MKVIVTKSFEESSRVVANLFKEVMINKPDARLGLATGGSVVKVYECLIDDYKKGLISFKDINTVNLDEYVGLDGDNDQSYRYFMNNNLFNHVDIDLDKTYVASGLGDVEETIKTFKETLAKKPIDIQLLGVGVSGHVGFNEAGEYLAEGPHKELLDESTIEANARFFEKKEDVPTTALTMGVGDIMKAEKVVLIATGLSKKYAIGELLTNDKITTKVPCTILKMHKDATIVIDEELADAIDYKY